MANNFEQIKALVDAGNKMGLSNTITRDYGIPLDYSSVYATYADAVDYAANSTKAYQGQIIAAEGTAYIIVAESQGKLGEADIYLKPIGVIPQGDGKSIEVSEEGLITLKGLADAAVGNLPRKAADGSVEWVPISSVVEGDTNTITLITESTGKTGVTQTYNEEATTYTYTISADVTLEHSNGVYTLKQNGTEIGTINIPKDMVVSDGTVVTATEEDKAIDADVVVGEKYIKLVISNQDNALYIPVKDLVDIYTVENTNTVEMSIDGNDKITANVKISAAEGNTLEAKEDGLYVNVPEISVPEYTITKTAGETEDTYKLQKDGVDVDVAIIVPHAYDDSALTARVEADEKALVDYITSNDSALNGVKTTAETAKATADKNVTDIEALDAIVTGAGLNDGSSSHTARIAALEAHDLAHANDYNALITRVGETETVANKAKTDIEALTAKDTELAGLVADNTAAIAKKADATALDNYYTKAQIGELGDKTAVALIEEAKTAGTNAATAVETLKNTEVKANADAIDVLNGDDTGKSVRVIAGEAANDAVAAMLSDSPEAFDTLKEIADWLGTHSADAIEMDNRIKANEDKLAGIETTVVAAIEASKYELPAATLDRLGGVKASEDITVAEDGTMSIAKVTTDVLVNGAEELILNGGNATVTNA